jgi:hypothetical protein
MHWNVTSRRDLLRLAGGFLALRAIQCNGARAESEREDLSDEVVRDILYEESEPGKQAKAVIQPYWFQQAIGTRPSPNWPADNISFDYAHLISQPNSDEPFMLTALILEKLAALNSFIRRPDLPRLLFGLRGCTLADGGDQTDWSQGHMVRATRPNHIDPKCLIGVWDTAKTAIALFKASTVPNVDLMEKQVEGSLGCNMLPTGFHQYQVGPHRGPRQPGAFRQQTPLWVHRSKKTLSYAANDPGNVWDDLDGDLPFDNIHAAMLSARKKAPFFSSAGCQVVAGAYTSNHEPTGPWAKFRTAAGLAHPPDLLGASGNTKDDGRQFEYLLLTGKDAQLAAQGAPTISRALRFGSSGGLVSELQHKLATKTGIAIDDTGVFDRKTLGNVIRWQVAEKLAPTGIVSIAEAGRLGLNWT